jgi:alpha-tubulin suppressor-like RCC1 family protein
MVAAGPTESWMIDMENNLYRIGYTLYNFPNVINIPINEMYLIFDLISDIKVQTFSIGEHHQLFIDLNNNVYVRGIGYSGEMNLRERPDQNRLLLLSPNIQVQEVAAGIGY